MADPSIPLVPAVLPSDTAVSAPPVVQTAVQPPAAPVADEPNDFDTLVALVQTASQSVIVQDAKTARECAYQARGIYEDAREKYDEDELSLLGVLRDIICLFDPIATGLVMSLEGRYTDALARIDEASQMVQALQQTFAALSPRPTFKEVLSAFEPMMRPYPALLRGSRISTQAELSGYQGNIRAYIDLLHQASAAYRTVKDLRPSNNPTFRQLVQICMTLADRLDTRSHNFEPMLDDIRYVAPDGDKILIIHGRNEGKWRELKDLLVKRGREVVVVEEMPDNGAVLIDKCIKYASECCYAIALFTPDDMVKAGKTKIFQARPNVIFELGWFYGRFGPTRVLMLKQDETEMPSDLAGVVTKNFHTNVQEVIDSIMLELPPGKAQALTA